AGPLLGLVLLAALSLPHLRAANDEPKSNEGSPRNRVAAEERTVAQNQSTTEAKQTAESPKEATVESEKSFDLRVVGPDGKPVPHVEVQFRGTPLPTAEQVKVGTFARAGRYGVFVAADAEGRMLVEFPRPPEGFYVFIQAAGYGPYCAKWASE